MSDIKEIAAELLELCEELCEVATEMLDDEQAERVIHLASQVRGRGLRLAALDASTDAAESAS